MGGSAMIFCEDEIDFEAYLAEEEHHKVRAAASYEDEVGTRIEGDVQGSKLMTPWPKLNADYRLRKGELTVWTGYKGHGKTTALSQLALSAVAQGEKLLILSMEFAPAETLRKSLVQCALQLQPDARYRKQWFRWTDDKIWLYDNKGGVTPDKVVGVIRHAVAKYGVTMVIVDSLMKCGIRTEDYDTQKDFTDRLQRICHEKDTQIHLVAHSRKKEDDSKPAQMHDVKGASEIVDMAENVISFWRNKKKEKNKDVMSDDPDACLIVEAQRNGSGWIGVVRLWWNWQSQQYTEEGCYPIDYSKLSPMQQERQHKDDGYVDF